MLDDFLRHTLALAVFPVVEVAVVLRERQRASEVAVRNVGVQRIAVALELEGEPLELVHLLGWRHRGNERRVAGFLGLGDLVEASVLEVHKQATLAAVKVRIDCLLECDEQAVIERVALRVRAVQAAVTSVAVEDRNAVLLERVCQQVGVPTSGGESNHHKGWLALAFVVTAVTLAVVYLCSDRPGRVALEQRALDVVDGVREDGTTPGRVVGWLDQVADRAEEAWTAGATEVCLQGGIDPKMPVTGYADIVRAIKARVPGMHVHAFSPMEIANGVTKSGMSIADWLISLREAGLDTIPGTAAEILDDDVRAVLCPDKVSSEEWLEAHRTAHRVGLRSNVTMMFGAVESPESWARHLVITRDLQAETGGFTEPKLSSA